MIARFAIAAALLVANAFFVWAEFALITARRTRVEQLAERGHGAARAALSSMRELSLMLAGAQLGITMASLGLGFVAEPAVARLIENTIGDLVTLSEGLLHGISFVIALTIVVYLHMVVGEMMPKNIAIAEPERSVLWVAIPFGAYARVARPVIWFLNAIANWILRLLGVPPRDELEAAHTSQEIARMLAASRREGLVAEFEHRLLAGTLRFATADAASIMVPRAEVVAVPATASVAEVEDVVARTGRSRLPVWRQDLDDVRGFVHAMDLLRIPPDQRQQPLPRSLIRTMPAVPASRRLPDLLQDMRNARAHLALVASEHGGTKGIITMEDIVEQLVGEIRDEYEERPRPRVRPVEHGVRISGAMRLGEMFEATGCRLPEGDYETVAGFILARLGRLARRGDEVQADGWRLRVAAVRRRRVLSIDVEPPAQWIPQDQRR